jgi:hypothetical protein
LDLTRIGPLLREQQAAGFRDVAGAQASATIPLSDRLVTRLASEFIPRTAPFTDVDLRALGGNRLSVRVRLTNPVMLPPVTVKLQIEQQPQFPSSPMMGLRLLSTGILLFAKSITRLFDVLPPGIRLDGDRILVNIQTLAEARGFGEYLRFVEHLEVHTEEGRFVVSVGGRI